MLSTNGGPNLMNGSYSFCTEHRDIERRLRRIEAMTYLILGATVGLGGLSLL